MRKLHKTIKVLTVLATVLALSTIAQGEEIGGTIGEIKVNTVKVIKIKKGINSIDLNGDGKKDMVIGGYRGHITAHSFTIHSFYVYKKLTYGETTYEWQIVSIGGSGGFSGDDIEKYIISTHQGADCVLREIRLVRFKEGSSYYLVIANRPIGESYVDTLNINFSFYKLIYDKDESRFIYEKVKEINSKNKYCDANKAFEKELGY